MQQIVNLTSQGQLTLPLKMRKKLNIEAPGKVTLSIDNNRLIIKPVIDILSLGGILNKYAMKDKSIEEIRALEKAAAREGYTRRYK